MKNHEIIIAEVIANEIMTEEEVEKYLAAGALPPVHTYQEWKRLGYQVRKGEKAVIKTNLWKFTNKPSKQEREALADGKIEEKDIQGHFYMAPAYLFTEEQVDKAEPAKEEKNATAKKSTAKKAPAKKKAAKKSTTKKNTKKAPEKKIAASIEEPSVKVNFLDGTEKDYRNIDPASFRETENDVEFRHPGATAPYRIEREDIMGIQLMNWTI